MAISTDYLETFIDLYDSKSFSKTANNLGISEATVSYRIKELEKFFQKDLFVRGVDKTVTNTDFAIELYKEVTRFLRSIYKLRGSSDILDKELDLTISSGEIAAIYLLPTAIKSFEDKYKNIKIKVEITSSYETIENVTNKTADMGFVVSLNFPKFRDAINKIKVVRLQPVELVVIAPIGHPILERPDVRIHDIMQYKYISRKETSGVQAEIKKLLEQNGLPESDLNIVYEFDNSSSVVNAVSEGLGISISTSIQASRYVASGMIGSVPLKTKISTYIYVLDGHNGTDEVVNAFISFIR